MMTMVAPRIALSTIAGKIQVRCSGISACRARSRYTAKESTNAPVVMPSAMTIASASASAASNAPSWMRAARRLKSFNQDDKNLLGSHPGKLPSLWLLRTTKHFVPNHPTME